MMVEVCKKSRLDSIFKANNLSSGLFWRQDLLKRLQNGYNSEEDSDIIVELEGLVASCYVAKRYFAE